MLRVLILYLTHHFLRAKHSGQQKVYDMWRRAYCWPHMASDFYTTVARCKSCVRNRSLYSQKQSIQPFPASGLLKIIARRLLGPLPKTNQSSQYISVMKDCYSKLTKAIPIFEAPSTHMANIYLDHRIVQFSITTYHLTDNGP